MIPYAYSELEIIKLRFEKQRPGAGLATLKLSLATWAFCGVFEAQNVNFIIKLRIAEGPYNYTKD